jgi:hypothetical protein
MGLISHGKLSDPYLVNPRDTISASKPQKSLK